MSSFPRSAAVRPMLVTHHIEEIIPEIERVVMLRGGKILADGPRAELLRDGRLSELFGGPIPFTQEDVANYVGVTRVTVNQLFGSMIDEGLIQVRRGSVTVIDEAGIRAQI